MKEEDYLKDRLENQIEWYDRKSTWNQKWYKLLQVVSIMAAASIPFLSSYITEASVFLRIAVGILGILIVVVTAIINLYKLQENWLQYRTICESLRHEKYLYLTGSDPYSQADPFKLLVERVESLISKENTAWKMNMKKEEKK